MTSPAHQSGGYRTWHMELLRHGHLVSQWTVRSPAEGVLYWASFVIHDLPISNAHTGVKEKSCLSHLWAQSSSLGVWLSRNWLGCDLRSGFPTTLRWYLWHLLPSNLMLCRSHQLNMYGADLSSQALALNPQYPCYQDPGNSTRNTNVRVDHLGSSQSLPREHRSLHAGDPSLLLRTEISSPFSLHLQDTVCFPLVNFRSVIIWKHWTATV